VGSVSADVMEALDVPGIGTIAAPAARSIAIGMRHMPYHGRSPLRGEYGSFLALPKLGVDAAM
jgi:hypothetical protein